MELITPSILIIWLVAANFLLVIFIIIDRFKLNKKKAEDLENQFIKEALNNLHAQIQKTNRDLSNNTLQFQERAQNQTLELLASIRATIFSRYETEFQLIDESVKKNIQSIDGEVNHVLQDIKKYVENNNGQISSKYNAMSTELEKEILKIIEDADQKINEGALLAKSQIKQYMQKKAELRINTIVAEVLHGSITLKDHEKLIEDSVQEFIIRS